MSQPHSSDTKLSETSKAATAERSIPLQGNRLDSQDLFKSGRELIIIHGDDQYRLRLTAQNKLILTK